MGTNPRALGALTLLITSLGSFMVLLDGSIIFVALPEIQRSLGSDLSSLQWTVDAYTLPFAALMLTAGTLGDRLGRKKVFIAGLVLFLIGSAMCGFADGLSTLIAGRLVQGLGAGAISTGSLSLLVSTFTDPPRRAKAIGIWTAVSGISLALGPLVGGLLINAFSWEAIFLVNLPIGMLALILGVRVLQESRNPEARSIDLPGQVLLAGSLTCLVLGLIQAQELGWTSTTILGLLAAAIVGLIAFVAVEQRSSEPLLPLEFFRNRTFTAACGVAAILGFTIVGSMFFATQFLQSVQGSSALRAGLQLLPLTLGIFFLSPPASKIAGKRGPRIPVIVGSLVTAAGLLLLTTLQVDSPYSTVWWKLLLVGAGIGLMFAPLTVAVMASVPPQGAGLGSSMINTTRITGFTAGAAVLGTLVVRQFERNLHDGLVSAGVPSDTSQDLAERIGGAGAQGATNTSTANLPLPQEALTGVAHTAFVDALDIAFIVCAVGTLLAAVIAAAVMARGQLAGPAGQQNTAPPATEGRPSHSALMETNALQAQLTDPNVVVVDCSVGIQPKPEGGVSLTSGREPYDQGHIPGAVFADLLHDFSDSSATRPFALPPIHDLARALERLGIGTDSTVVLYDRSHSAFATRMWWVLRSIGVTRAFVLNGGLTKWQAEGRALSTKAPEPLPGTLTPVADPEYFTAADEVVDAMNDSSARLVNALSPEQHSGKVPVAHGRSGHIPTSVNLPAVSLLDHSSGAFLPPETLLERVSAAGIGAADKVIAYCAAGPNATSVAFILRELGMDRVSVYDAGLAEWSADPARPLTATT